MHSPLARSTDFYWDSDGLGSGIGGSGNWDTITALWRSGSSTGGLQTWSNSGINNDAYLTGSPGILTLTEGISVNDVTSSANFEIKSLSNQVLTLNGISAQVLSINSGSTLTISAAIAGTSGMIKTGSGTLEVGNLSNSIVGGITIIGGAVQAPGAAAASAFRNNDIIITSGSLAVRSDGTTSPELRVGALSGSGAFGAGATSTSLLSLVDRTFTGSVNVGSGGLTIRGTGIQTLASSATTFTGPVNIGSQAGLAIGGDGSLTAKINGINLRDRGRFTLDKSGANWPDRIDNATPLITNGGTFAFAGNSSGSAETLGTFTAGPGQSTIQLQHNATSAATVLTFASLIKGETGTAVNFVSAGAPFVTSGNGPRIVFSTTPTGVLPGAFAVVNGSDFATYSGGVIPVTSSNYGGSGTLPSLDINLTNSWSPTGSVTLNSLKITPSGPAQSISLGSSTLNVPGILLNESATADFTISGGSFGAGSRYFHIWNPDRTLIVGSLLSSGSSVTKAGDGFLSFSGSADLVNFTTGPGNIYLLGGTLRASLGVNFGIQNLIYFRGGVLEIANGVTFNRKADGNKSGITFEGSGGFSAFGSDAIVNLNSVGPLVWGGSGFLKDGDALLFGSTQSNARLTFQNPINLSGSGYNAREFRVFDNPNSTNDVATVSGILSGPLLTDLLKTGSGTLELSALNTFAGNVIIQEGTLVVSNGAALPDGGTVLFADAPGVALRLNTNETIGTLSGGGVNGGSVALQGNRLTVGDQRDSVFSGTISGANGTLLKQGSGVLTLTGQNGFTGGTTIAAGAVRFGTDNALPVSTNPVSSYGVTLSGGTLMPNGYRLGTLDNAGMVTQRAGPLTLTANSTLSLEPNVTNQILVFSDFNPGAAFLTIMGWTGTAGGSLITGGQLLFPVSGWDSNELSSIIFKDFDGASGTPATAILFATDPNFYTIAPSPVPEPKTIWAGIALLAVAILQQASLRCRCKSRHYHSLDDPQNMSRQVGRFSLLFQTSFAGARERRHDRARSQ